MKKLRLMGQRGDELVFCDPSCSRCNGTGQRGRVTVCLKDQSNSGKYIPCRCVVTQKVAPKPVEKEAENGKG